MKLSAYIKPYFHRKAWIACMAALLMAATGCNDEIFFEDFEPEDTSYTLPDNGSQCAINFASGDWDYLWVRIPDDVDANQKFYFTVCDPRGNVITRGQTRSARLQGRGYIHIESEGLSVYFMRDTWTRILAHAEEAPSQPLTLVLTMHTTAASLNEHVFVTIGH